MVQRPRRSQARLSTIVADLVPTKVKAKAAVHSLGKVRFTVLALPSVV